MNSPASSSCLSDDERDALIADERAAAEAAEAEAAQGVESDTGTPASAWKETAADTILKQMTGWKSVCDGKRHAARIQPRHAAGRPAQSARIAAAGRDPRRHHRNPVGRARKKLKDAAAYWARGGKDDGKAAQDDFELWGLASDETAAWIGVDEKPAHFEVWRENWPILEVFLAMGTQWLWTGGMEPRRAGLNLVALPVVYEGLQVAPDQRPEVFQGIQVMEAEALKIMNS